MLITIVTCEITNGHNSMKLRNKLDHIIGNHVLEFRFRTIDRLGDIEKTLILSKLEFIPKIIRINKKKLLHVLQYHQPRYLCKYHIRTLRRF